MVSENGQMTCFGCSVLRPTLLRWAMRLQASLQTSRYSGSSKSRWAVFASTADRLNTSGA